MNIGNEHGYTRYRGLIGKAIRLLHNGEQLPLTSRCYCSRVGVDVERLERRYGT